MIFLEVRDRNSDSQSKWILLYQRFFLIGRHKKQIDITRPCHLYLKDRAVSSVHCHLIRPYFDGRLYDDYRIYDGAIGQSNYSKNGIYVNGEKTHCHKLSNGDEIFIGNNYLLVYWNKASEDLWKKTQ